MFWMPLHNTCKFSIIYFFGATKGTCGRTNPTAKKKGFPYVFTDLGLAPGLVNILGEHGCTKVDKPTDVKMMVGGLELRNWTIGQRQTVEVPV